MSDGIRFPADLARLIEANWGRRSIRQAVPELPASDHLIEFLSICFFASLQKEEGRNTQFNVALLPREYIKGKVHYRASEHTFSHSLFELGSSRPFAVHELVKLSPALNPEKTVLLVDFDGRRFEIWGFLDVGWPAYEPHMWNGLSLFAVGPADFEVFMHNSKLCRYSGGSIHIEKSEYLDQGDIYDAFRSTSEQLFREVEEACPNRQGLVDLTFGEKRLYFLALHRLLQILQRLSHGGCILMVDDERLDRAIVSLKYPCKSEVPAVWTALRGLGVLKIVDDPASPLDYGQLRDVEKALAESLEVIAHLSSVDGAVVITKKFELLGFGAVIRLPETPDYRVIRCNDRDISKPEFIDVAHYGTRHRSAFEFCHHSRGSVALLASQDGGVKLVVANPSGPAKTPVLFWDRFSFNPSSDVSWVEAASALTPSPSPTHSASPP